MRQKRMRWAAAVLLAAAWAAAAWAAENPPAIKPQTPAPAAAPAPAPAPAAPAEKPAATEPVVIKEESIYIPYTKLREVFEKEGRGVFLPYEKFQALWQAAREKTAPTPEGKPPVDALISEVDNKATVSKDVITVAAVMKIEILKEGWNEVPLRLNDVALTKATIDDQPARIVADAAQGYKLLVEKKGKAPQQVTLALGFAKAYTKAPGQNSVSFESPPAPVSKWEVTIPESGVKVNISPLLAATEVPPAAGAADKTVIQAFVGAAPTVRVEWTPKAEGAKGLEALATVQVQQQTSVEEGVTRTRAQLAYEISRAELARLEVEVPADVKVVNVFDPNVREWSVAPADQAQKVTIQLFEPAKAAQNLAVELEKFSTDQALDVKVPILKALGVGRQQGVVVVQVASGLRAEATEHTGLMQLDAGDLPQALAKGKWDFSYRYAALPFNLVLHVEKVQPRVLAESLVEAHLATESLTVDLLTVYTVERAGVFRLELDVPEGFDVRTVRGLAAAGAEAAQVDSHHLEGANKTRLLVNLSRKALGKVALAVQLHKALHEPDLLTPTGKAADIPLAIPRVAPATVERETGRLVVYAPESLRVNPGKTAGLRPISYQEAIQNMRSTQKGGTERPVLSFAYTQEPASTALAAERRKPYLTARQLLVARIDSGVVKYEATLFYEVLYSGVKSLRVDVPQDLAGELRVEPTTLRHEAIPAADKPQGLADGYVAWRLSGDTEFIGQVQVRLLWEKKIEKLDVGKSVDLAIPRLIPRDIDRAWGQIVLAKAETIDVQESTGKDKVAGLRPIDPQHDLMTGAAVPGAARAFEFHDDWALTVVATMYKLEEVKHTSIERAVVRIVVTRGDQLSVQALYRMRSARQRLLMKLPANVEFDIEPLRLNGKAVSLERGEAQKNEFFVPLVGQSADAPFLLELRYTLKGAGLSLECPAFPEEPAIQKVYLSAWLPREWDYLGSVGPWTPELHWVLWDVGWRPMPNQDDASLIRWVREGVPGGGAEQSFQTDGRPYLFSTLRPEAPPAGGLRLVAMDSLYFAVLVCGTILVVGIALVFTRAGVRLLGVGAFVVLVVLLGVFAPTFAMQMATGVTAAAAVVVLVLWALWWLLVTRPRDPRVIARREARLAALAAAKAPAAPPAAPASTPPPTGGPPAASPPPPQDKGEGGETHA